MTATAIFYTHHDTLVDVANKLKKLGVRIT